jgi:PAS domain S-box-containing protein
MNSRDVSDRVMREEQRDRDHTRLEQSAAESENRFQALTEQAPELISELDPQGRYTFANQGYRELLGIDPKTLIGRAADGLVHPAGLPASRAGISQAYRIGATAHMAHRLRHADGSWRWFENTGRTYRSASGALRFVSIGRDVTESRRQEQERRELEHQMREVQRLDSLGALAGGIAHDFNNLLAVILGNVTLLESADLTVEDRGRLQRIHSAAAHAEGLTDQMLTYAGKSVADLVPLDLSKLVSETENLLRATMADRGKLEQRLELELDAELPSVRGDAIDAVLLDLEMPGFSGAELLEQLRYERPDLPVVVASGYKRDLAADRLRGSQTFGFVQKPFDPRPCSPPSTKPCGVEADRRAAPADPAYGNITLANRSICRSISPTSPVPSERTSSVAPAAS